MNFVTKEEICQKLGDFLINYRNLRNLRELEDKIIWFHENLELYVELNNHSGDAVEYKNSVEKNILRIIVLNKESREKTLDDNNN